MEENYENEELLSEAVSEEKNSEDPVSGMPEKNHKEKRPHRLLHYLLGLLTGILLAAALYVGYTGYIMIPRGNGEPPVTVLLPTYYLWHTDMGDNQFNKVEIMRKLDEVEWLISQNYLYDLDEQKVEDGIIAGLMFGLYDTDKYADYYDTEYYSTDVKPDMNGNFKGIGVTCQKNPDGEGILIIEVMPEGGAFEAGMQRGDIVLEADGVDLRTMDLAEATSKHIKGADGTWVCLLIERDGEELELDVQRHSMEVISVRYTKISAEDKTIGYINVSEFNTKTAKQFKAAVDQALSDGAEGIVLDLRSNGGGDMETSIVMADYLLPDDLASWSANGEESHQGETLLMYMANRRGKADFYYAKDGHQVDVPIVVLTNEGSASASEILTGALKCYGAKSVGVKTYGKGIVQTVYTLYDLSAVKFTTAQYMLPSGAKIHDVGIGPDVIIRPDDILAATGFSALYPDPEIDNQLERALQVCCEEIIK